MKSLKNLKHTSGMAKDQNSRVDQLMLHYMRSRQDMDTRRTRKNGWNEVITSYMGKLPSNWPFLAVVTDPRLRTAITEKNARLINGKLRGRLVPRNSGSVEKAKIQNAILDFQWDYANEGGSMIEKVALADQYTRLFGAAWGLTYWDTKKDSNELKIIDPRDIGWDGAATHPKNARWCQVREWTTWDKLAARGYNVASLKKKADKNEIGNQWRSTAYESIVKGNRGLMDRVGEPDDPTNPIVEVVTEWTCGDSETPGQMTIFLPRFSEILEESENPYKHGEIPISMLRYHTLIDDIYGETDAEYVLPLARAINATLCGFVDEMTITQRPPLKIASSGVRTETIEYGPGAQWIMDNPNLVQEMQFSPHTIQSFNATYPALVAAFNTAMGDNSLGISNTLAKGFSQKTATEVNQLQNQQNTRDQSNQTYLSEFLKDIMMKWLSNNKQYLFDDPTKQIHIQKIIGPEAIGAFQQLKLDGRDIPPEAMQEITNTVDMAAQAGNPLSEDSINQIMQDVSVPTNPVIVNPEEKNPENYEIKSKLDVKNAEEADLYVTPEDFDGEYDYIPDVSSMASGASQQQQQARENALQLLLLPQTLQLLQLQGVTANIKDLLVKKFEDAGYTDAEAMFEPLQQQPMGAPPMGGVPGQVMPPTAPAPNMPQPNVNPNVGVG